MLGSDKETSRLPLLVILWHVILVSIGCHAFVMNVRARDIASEWDSKFHTVTFCHNENSGDEISLDKNSLMQSFRFLELNHAGRTGRFGGNDILDPKMTSDHTWVPGGEWGFWGFVPRMVSPMLLLLCRNILSIYWGSGQAASQVSQLIVEPSFHIPIKSQLEETGFPSSL